MKNNLDYSIEIATALNINLSSLIHSNDFKTKVSLNVVEIYFGTELIATITNKIIENDVYLFFYSHKYKKYLFNIDNEKDIKYFIYEITIRFLHKNSREIFCK